MSKGIVLISIGKRGYGFMAYNLAYSIKKFNPDLQITLLHDEGSINQLHEEWKMVFDNMISLDENLFFTNGTFDPCKMKCNVYDLLPYENNLYLDVDACALQDIEPMLDECIKSEKYYLTYIIKERKPDDILNFIWADRQTIVNHFNLKQDVELNASQTSIQFIKKCSEAKTFFNQLKLNYVNPLPLDKLRYTWGGGQPDELYINVTIAQSEIDAQINPNSIFFGGTFDERPLHQIQSDHYILSIFGGKTAQGNPQTKLIYLEWYDRLLSRMHSEDGTTYSTTTSYFLNDKYANNRGEKIRQTVKLTNLQTAKIPISESKKIDSSKLLQSYAGPNGEKVIVSNWFNCSITEFEDKIYFVYRMENRPWCTRTKIAICLLDENLQPIPETNNLLELHSDLKHATLQRGISFKKGFHVEDPRLFVFNNQLFISYTDGYQMGQARINTETLQAEESFYLNNISSQEKNWVFFEYDKKLYSIYWTSPHQILEMNGQNFIRAYDEPFKNNWQWGIIRGGTSPMFIEGHYISFFHSAIDITYKGNPGRQYFMGAYLFEAEPPFKPIAISSQPLICGEVINDSIPRLSNKIFVVFPSGAIRREDSWIVSFGYNDVECRYIEITDELLNDNLTFMNKKEMVV